MKARILQLLLAILSVSSFAINQVYARSQRASFVFTNPFSEKEEPESVGLFFASAVAVISVLLIMLLLIINKDRK